MIKPEEKLKLMLELGLEGAAVKYAEANNLTAMKFQPITEEKINSLLSVSYKDKRSFDWENIFCTGFMGFFVAAIFGGVLLNSLPITLSIATGIISLGFFMGRPKMVTEEAIVCDVPLEDWEDNLPYGALLSVQEAKRKGFKNFTIYFPAKRGSRYGVMQRIKADPIIVAHKKNSRKLYNIFAWDDGKVYE